MFYHHITSRLKRRVPVTVSIGLIAHQLPLCPFLSAAREDRARARHEALHQQEQTILEPRATADALEERQKQLLAREDSLSAQMSDFEARLKEARKQCASSQQAVEAAMTDLEHRYVLHPLRLFVSLCTAGKRNRNGSGVRSRKNRNGKFSHSPIETSLTFCDHLVSKKTLAINKWRWRRRSKRPQLQRRLEEELKHPRSVFWRLVKQTLAFKNFLVVFSHVQNYCPCTSMSFWQFSRREVGTVTDQSPQSGHHSADATRQPWTIVLNWRLCMQQNQVNRCTLFLMPIDCSFHGGEPSPVLIRIMFRD